MTIPHLTRRAGELCLDCIRDAAPESEPAIEFTPSRISGRLVATITATINGKRQAVSSEFVADSDWDGIDNGEWLAATFWYEVRRAFGIELADSNDRTGGLPRSLRPTCGPELRAGREVPGLETARIGFWR